MPIPLRALDQCCIDFKLSKCIDPESDSRFMCIKRKHALVKSHGLRAKLPARDQDGQAMEKS